LQLEDIPFRIRQVDELDSARVRHVQRHHLPDLSTASRQHRLSGSLNVVDLKCDVRESRAVDRGLKALVLGNVLEDLLG